MPHYLLSVYQPEGPPPANLSEIMSDVDAINDELKSVGAWVFGERLCPPSTATVVRPHNGEVLTTDGPFAEAKEFLGGFTIIDATDLDCALHWADRLARAITLPIEVRPFLDMAGGS